MPEATIDHIVSLIVFIAALLIFIGLFNNTMQTAVSYQQHAYLATECSNLLDNVLLNPGSPLNQTYYWGTSNATPTVFGLQDPESGGYALSPFSLMRLNSGSKSPVYYSKTDLYYSNETVGFGENMFAPLNEVVNYSTAQTLLGINNTYGFQLMLTPIINVSITQTQPNPLTLSINVHGIAFPLTNANVSYCFINVSTSGSYPSYSISYGTTITNYQGLASLNLNGTAQSYALVAYADLSGLVGVGYYENVAESANYVIPLVSDFDQGKVVLAHSYDILGNGDPTGMFYNATFVLRDKDFTFSNMPLTNSTGTINSGYGTGYGSITIPAGETGTLIITYSESSTKSGVVVMPWGVSSMAFPVTFGDSTGTNGKEWVASDLRQVVVDGISYQARLSLWSLLGYTVVK